LHVIQVCMALPGQTAVHRKPDAGRIGARTLDPMLLMGGNEYRISGFELDDSSVRISQRGAALQKSHPFVPLLIVPFPGRSRLTGGDDSLDQDTVIRDQRFE